MHGIPARLIGIGALIIALLALDRASATPLSQAERAAATSGALASCLKRQLAEPQNQSLSSQTIRRYCVCVADEGTNLTTKEDLKAFREGQFIDYEGRMTNAGVFKRCADSAVRR